MLKLYLRALFAFDLEAIHDLGAIYGSGSVNGVKSEKAIKRAALFYRVASLFRHPESQYDLGFMIINGEIPKIDYQKGMSLIKESASAGFKPAEALYHALNYPESE